MLQTYELSDRDIKTLQEKNINIDEAKRKLKKNYPIQYLIGNVNFYGYIINVNKNVLIPRFETETLVEKTIQLIKNKKLETASVLEIGTGSGCISIVMKAQIPTLTITAIDINFQALKIARKNALNNKTNINFLKKDIFNFRIKDKYDIIISNPPYIKIGEKIDIKTKFEPKNAIYAEQDGLIYYIQIFKIAKKLLSINYLIALEIGEEQGDILAQMASNCFENANIKIEKDLANKDRYLFIYK